MKQKIDRTKTPAKRFSTRTVALVMSIVMLIGSIATGSVLNTFAAYIKDNAAKDAISETATEGSDIAESAIPSEDADTAAQADDANEKPDLSGFEENEIVRGLKSNLDLATTGASGDWYIVGNVADSNNWSERDEVKLSAVTGGYSISIKLTKDKDFRLRHNSSDYGAAGSSDSERKVNSSTSNHTLSQTNETFIWTGETGTYTVSINSDGSKISFDSSVPGGGTSPTSAPSGSIGTKVTDANLIKILNGTDVSFYIESYTDKEWTDLCNSSRSTPTYTRYGKIGTRWGKSYVQIAKTDRTSYDRITNNKSSWNGDENTAIKTATGGEHFVKNGTGNVSAVGSTTTINSSYQTTDTMSIVTKSNATKTAFTEDSAKVFDMTIKYYIQSGNDFYHIDGKDYTATTSNKTQSYALSGLSAGDYKLITLAVDSEDYVRYIADSDNFTVTAEAKHAVTFNTSGSGTVTPVTGTEVGESTPTTITATPASGYQFSGWTFGSGITGASTANATTTITTKSSGTYTVTANFTKKTLNVTKGTHAHGDFTVPATAQVGDTVTISNISIDKGYTAVSFSTTPTTTISGSGTANRTFTMPGEDVTVNATYTAKSGNTITGTASPSVGGTIYYGTSSTASSTTSFKTYTTGDTRYVRAAEKAGYDFNKIVVTYADGTTAESTTNKYIQLNTDGSKFSSENDGSISVVAYFTKKPTHKVTVVSNNNSYGTATTSVVDAYQGQSVKLTATENSGTWSKWTVTSGSMSTVHNKTTNPLTFTMGSEDLTITANFTDYEAQSNYYYNGYTTSAGQVSGKFAQRMTEGKLGGKTYSYYHVTGRSGSEQLMTVSYGNINYDNSNTWVYFTRPSWDDTSLWGNSASQYAMFYSSDQTIIKDWEAMAGDASTDGGYRFKIQIPDRAVYVRFKDGTTQHQTSLINLNNKNGGTYSHNGFYLSSSTHSDSTYTDIGHYDMVDGLNKIPDVYEWYQSSTANGTVYKDSANTVGFGDYGITEVSAVGNASYHRFAKPNTSSTDYYVLLFYQGVSYNYNGTTINDANNHVVLIADELPDSGDTIKVYAKDGAIAGYGQTYADLADTTVLKADGTTSAGATKYTSTGNQTYEVYKAQPGETITIKTTIGLDKNGNALTSPTAASLRAKYYVRGFMVNGEVPKNTQITTPDTTNGVYTLTYTVPEDYTGKYIEITPVYFLADTTANPVVTFRATNFPKGQHHWGDTPYVYPFYGKLGSYNNAFGVYAGQPMFFYNGQYTMQIPQKSTAWAFDSNNTFGAASSLAEVNNITVSGVTMSNGYYDTVHKLIMGYGDNSASADHVQTYDYGDFYKIFNEKKPVDNIVFDFKYETTKHNFESNPAASYTKTQLDTNYGTNGNGFEDLKNFHGRNVDLFGDPLSGDQLNATPVYVVSIGGVNGSAGVENIAGYYATEWMVYGSSNGTNYSRISAGGKNSIPPEVLVLNDDDNTSFNDTTYPSADASHKLTDWKALYTALEAYRGKPVKISYEAADAQIGAGNYATSGSGGATRNDGRWLYSKTGESITSKIKIEYSDNNGTTWVENPASGETGHIDGLSAYFTNTEVYGEQTYATTIDPDKTFDFEAKTTNANYKFVGWYMDDDNKTPITSDNDGSTERSGSYTFIARFKLVTSGQLILSHTVDTDTIGGTVYDGAGTVTIGAVVKDGDGNTKRTYAPSTSDITIDNAAYISSDSACTIDVTLTATRGNNSALGTTILATPSGQDAKFFDYGDFTLSDDGKTRTYTFTVNVRDLYSGTIQTYKNLIYHSYFKNYVFNYTVNYEFTARDGQQKIYNRAGTLTAPEAETYIYKQTVSGQEQRWIKKDFFESIAPYESNFQQSMTWNISDSYFTQGTNYVYTCNAHFTATNAPDLDKLDVTFVLPYQHTNGVATLNSEGFGTAATATNYAMIKESDSVDNRVTFGEIPVLTGNRTNGIYTDEEKSHWIAAPLKLDNGTFFSHWSVKTTDTKTEVARCYFPGFNFLAYDNYEITAVYGDAPVDLDSTGVSTAVTYLDTTRNQWNALTSSAAAVLDVPASDKVNAGDILYNDFVLSYNYNGVDIYQGGSDTNDITELGIVVERIKELDKNSDDTYDTRISSYTALAQETTKITDAATTAGDANTGQKTIKDATTGKQYYKQSINKTALDNKNRIVFFEAFSNTAGWNSEKQRPVGNYSYKKYVYRAYTYITYNDGGTSRTVLSETPAYFIMYDIATANYSAN